MKKVSLLLCIISSLTIVIICLLMFVPGGKYFKIMLFESRAYGQNMSFIITTPTHKIFVIDGGRSDDAEFLTKRISSLGGKVNGWFLTHYHGDHTGALAKILTTPKLSIKIEIDTVYCNFPSASEVEKYENIRKIDYDTITLALKEANVQSVRAGDILPLGDSDNDGKIEILRVYNPLIYSNFGNNSSMVFKFYLADKDMLFLGDLGEEGTEDLLSVCEIDKIKSFAVQMAHHGQAGAPEKLYQIINPRVCFWPTPLWLWENDAGSGPGTGFFKTLETRAWIDKIGAKNIVAKDGDQVFKIKAS